MATAFTKVQLRRGSAAEWTRYNTILDVGEIGFEDDTYRFKIGQINKETGELYDWKTLPYYGSTLNIDGNINISDDSCVNGNLLPCADNAYTIGDAAMRWKSVHAYEQIELNGAIITQGEAVEATGENPTLLKLDGDDLVTRTILNSGEVALVRATGPDGLPEVENQIAQYLYPLFEVLERQLPPTADKSVQANFNEWVVEALMHVDKVAHEGHKDEDGNVIIGGPDINVIIGPKPGPGEDPTCLEKVDIYAETTVHCMLDAKKGVKVLDADETHFVKANGTVSNELPLEQSYWVNVPRL